jgi:hypothetical protein
MADDELDRVLQGLEKAREFAGSYRFEMTDEYRALIAQVEAMPCNRPGSDKSAVWPALRAYVDSFKLVTRARRS